MVLHLAPLCFSSIELNCCQRSTTELTTGPTMQYQSSQHHIRLSVLRSARAEPTVSRQPLLSSPRKSQRRESQQSLQIWPQSDLTRSYFIGLLTDSSVTAQEIIFCVSICVLAFVPGPVTHLKLRGEMGKHCTKEKVPGEMLTNTEQRASRRRRRERRETHTNTQIRAHTQARQIKETVLHANTVYPTCLQLQNIT